MFIVLYGDGPAAREFAKLAKKAGHRVLGQNPHGLEKLDDTTEGAEMVVCDSEEVANLWKGSSVRVEALPEKSLTKARSLAQSLPGVAQERPSPTEGLVAPEHRDREDLFALNEDQLRALADKEGVDLGQVRKTESMVARIKEAREAKGK